MQDLRAAYSRLSVFRPHASSAAPQHPDVFRRSDRWAWITLISLLLCSLLFFGWLRSGGQTLRKPPAAVISAPVR